MELRAAWRQPPAAPLSSVPPYQFFHAAAHAGELRFEPVDQVAGFLTPALVALVDGLGDLPAELLAGLRRKQQRDRRADHQRDQHGDGELDHLALLCDLSGFLTVVDTALRHWFFPLLR